MKAWQFSSTQGGIEKNLVLNSSAPLPKKPESLSGDEVLVNVISAALNPVDYKLVELPIIGRFAVSRPSSPGLDFAGRVVSVGPNASQFQAGQPVFGRLDQPTKYGTLADFTVAHASAIAVIPDGVSVDDAAGVGTAGLTTFQSIVPYVKKGDSVFINGGSGGTGVWAIQIAKAKECYVVTSCSGANVALCERLGADKVIDYRSQDVVKALKEDGRIFDVVVDNVGTPSALYYQAHHYLGPNGTFVQVGTGSTVGAGWEMLMKLITPGFLGGGKRKLHLLLVKGSASELAEIGKWMQQKQVTSVVDEVMRLADAPRVFEKLRTGRAKGKIVVRMNDEA